MLLFIHHSHTYMYMYMYAYSKQDSIGNVWMAVWKYRTRTHESLHAIPSPCSSGRKHWVYWNHRLHTWPRPQWHEAEWKEKVLMFRQKEEATICQTYLKTCSEHSWKEKRIIYAPFVTTVQWPTLPPFPFPSCFCLSVCLSICLSVCPPTYPPVCLSVCLYLSICLSVSPQPPLVVYTHPELTQFKNQQNVTVHVRTCTCTSNGASTLDTSQLIRGERESDTQPIQYELKAHSVCIRKPVRTYV